MKEEDFSPQVPTVNRQKLKYVTVGQMQVGKVKMFQLVRKEICPGAMFDTFKTLLH